MKFGFIVILILIMTGGTILDAGIAPTKYEDLAQRVDSLFAAWNKPDTPGAAILITDGGHVALKRFYGMANLEFHIPITEETRFELASVSKQFTAFAISR